MDSASVQLSKKSSEQLWKFVLRFKTGVAGAFDSMKISGAVIFAVKLIYPGKFEEVYQSLKEGKIRFSSPMPVINGELYVFKPKIMAKNVEDRKSFKNVQFVPLHLAKKVMEMGEYDNETVKEAIEYGKNVEIRKMEIPKVAVSRYSQKSTIYYIGEDYPNDMAILVKIPDEHRTVISTALRFLGDRGISKKATWGLGSFVIKRKESINTESASRQTHLLLSRFAPNRDEMASINFKRSYYDLKVIVGKNRGGISFRQRVITEGSVLNFESMPTGKVLEMQAGDYKYSAFLTGLFI